MTKSPEFQPLTNTFPIYTLSININVCIDIAPLAPRCMPVPLKIPGTPAVIRRRMLVGLRGCLSKSAVKDQTTHFLTSVGCDQS